MNKFLIALFLTSSFAYAKTPSVYLRYSQVFDRWCSNETGIQIKRIEIDRLVAVFPELQKEWDNLGPNLLEKLESVLNKPFLESEMLATVFLCKKTPSMSMPLLINGNWFVKDEPQPSTLVVDIIFHELIHTYIVDNFPELWKSSPLLAKYKDEEPGVRSHLHLMAIQKKVYLELGLKERIEKVIEFDSDMYGGAYKRSWEIINSEGENKFLEELK